MSVPSIPSVTSSARPRWSVMIPAWNAAAQLTDTIGSVLAAGLPPGSQIEVVDDCSEDDTAAAVARFADRGVGYHRHDWRHGPSANFNACLRRATGELVHLLHADDRVRPGFYTVLEQAFASTDAVAAVARCAYIDESGAVLRITRRETASGIWEKAVATLTVSNRIRPAAIVVRRSAYEAVGGFREDLSHAADWDAWMRLARHGPIWFQDEVLAEYRVHPGQDTAAKVRSGENMIERIAALELIVDQLPPAERRAARRRGLLYSAAFAARTAGDLTRRREWKAAAMQLVAAVRCTVGGVFASSSMAAPLAGRSRDG